MNPIDKYISQAILYAEYVVASADIIIKQNNTQDLTLRKMFRKKAVLANKALQLLERAQQIGE